MEELHCNFCGCGGSDNTKLIESERNIIICNHCVAKAKLLIEDELYENYVVIDMSSPLSPTAA